uniref:Uncharacterized protein n=1 Tax=Daphnia galeata TaxID=27404 RepID=A0A8J2RIZ6_9CRUS|nr:unnamed protein product [Daphnia galeata]
MESQNSVTNSFGDRNSEFSMGLDAARYYLSKSVKNSTKQQYDRVYDVWRDFCQRNELEEFGASHEQLAACLSLVMMRDKSYSKVVTDPSPHLRILFKGGKNDLYTEGAERVVASNPTVKRCPVQLTLNYFKYLGTSYIGYLVPSCLEKNAPNPDKSVPYSGSLADMKKLMDSLGYDGKLYGEHSGKRGAAKPQQPMEQLTNNSNVLEAGVLTRCLPNM